MLLVVTQLFQNVRGFSPRRAGLLLLPFSLTSTAVSLPSASPFWDPSLPRRCRHALRAPLAGAAGRRGAAGGGRNDIGNANPRAYAAEIGPGRRIRHVDPGTEKAILAAADLDFVEGMRFSLAAAIVVLALVLAAGSAGSPRGRGGIADARREAAALEARKDGGVPDVG